MLDIMTIHSIRQSPYWIFAADKADHPVSLITAVISFCTDFYKPTILTYNDRTVTHLHIKWGVAVGPIVIGAGTRHLPPSRIHAPVTNPR